MSSHKHSNNHYGYHSKALAQYILLQHKLSKQLQLQNQILELKQKVYSKQTKHRRSDKQISKPFNCTYCQRIYASDVALKLHLKLKHPEQLQIVNSVINQNQNQHQEFNQIQFEHEKNTQKSIPTINNEESSHISQNFYQNDKQILVSQFNLHQTN